MSLSKKQLSLLPSYNLFFTTQDWQTFQINKDITVIESKTVKTPFNFNSLVLSVSAQWSKGAAMLLQCAVKTGKDWGAFYNIAYINQGKSKSFSLNKDAYAKVDTDTILPKQPALAFKYKITILGAANINMIAAAITNSDAKYNKELALDFLDEQTGELKLKPISQYQYAQTSLRARLCSPAALTMVLNYYGKKVNLKQVAQNVFDNNAQIYGNWVLNTAYAAQLGLNAFVLRCASLAQAQGQLLLGHPLIVSIAYKAGRLNNAAAEETKGHLVVLAGFDADGNAIVFDPAAKTAATVQRIYDRQQFADAWLKNKKGLAYAIAPLD